MERQAKTCQFLDLLKAYLYYPWKVNYIMLFVVHQPRVSENKWILLSWLVVEEDGKLYPATTQCANVLISSIVHIFLIFSIVSSNITTENHLRWNDILFPFFGPHLTFLFFLKSPPVHLFKPSLKKARGKQMKHLIVFKKSTASTFPIVKFGKFLCYKIFL